MDTPVQDYLAVREIEIRGCLGSDEYAELEAMAANMDAGLYSVALQADFGVALPVHRLLTVLTLGQFSQEVRIRLLTEKGREA